MAFDIKEKINEIVDKIKSDSDLKAKFEENPIAAIESIIGVDLPDGAVEKVVDGVKAKLLAGDIGEKLGKLGGLFGK